MDVDYFMLRQYENKLNNKMMYYNYTFPTGEVIEYIQGVCILPIEGYIDYIMSMPTPEIGAKDVFQFSSFADATDCLCQRLIEVGNPGLKHLEIGKLLLNDGVERNDGAYTKYGENHAKTATALGLVQELSKTYFLSCIGYVYPQLDNELKQRLTTRLILRNPFVSRIIMMTSKGKVDMRQFLYMLSDSTYTRRSSNIRTVLSQLEKTSEYDFSMVMNNINYIIERR